MDKVFNPESVRDLHLPFRRETETLAKAIDKANRKVVIEIIPFAEAGVTGASDQPKQLRRSSVSEKPPVSRSALLSSPPSQYGTISICLMT
jgi:hypothetical protein